MSEAMNALRWLASLAPTRLTGTKDEQKVHEAIAARMEAAGYGVETQEFRFPRHIYGSLALHFGLAILVAPIGISHPIPCALAHAVIAVSFYCEAELRRHVLRALWPTVKTRNVVATMPCASGRPTKRIVFLAHVDSAFTGALFRPEVIRVAAAPPPRYMPFAKKQLVLPLLSVVALAGWEAAGAAWSLPSWPVALLCVLPSVVFFFNFDILLRNEPVPGAGDNLTGCAAQLVMAEAWAKSPSESIEVVFAFTGAEEAGTGGASNLVARMRERWRRDETVIVVLDTLSNGELFLLEEGELRRKRIPADLAAAVAAAALDSGTASPQTYVVPAGATDALPFLIAGYRAVALTCIDPAQHAPRNYHHPNDTVDRVDEGQLDQSVLLAGALLRRLAA